MATDLIDPFDNPGQPVAAKSQQGSGLVDPFDDPSYATAVRQGQAQYGGQFVQGGTAETVTGAIPSSRNLLNTPNPLPIMDRVRAGAMEDPQAKLSFLAERRFGDPRAASRYGYIDGVPVYAGDDGSIYREDMGMSWASGALPLAASVVGGVLGGPPGAALGGAGGRAGQKLVGLQAGDDQSASGNAFDLSVGALLDAAGWKVGDMIGGKMVDRKLSSDIAKFSRADAVKMQRVARDKFGIDLTPAEASNLRSLLADQTRLGMGIDDAGNIIREFMERRAGQVDDAVSGYIGRPPSLDVAGRATRDVARQSIDDATAGRAAATRASYRMLDRNNPQIPEKAFESIEANDLAREFINKAVENPRFGLMDTPRNSYRVIDRAGKLMRDEAEELSRKGKSFEASVVQSARQRLLGTMDDIVPGYRETRQVFANQSKPIEELEQGIEGVIAGIKDRGMRKIADTVFNASGGSADDVAKLRMHFTRQGKDKEWSDLTNAYLRRIWEGSATKDVQGGANPMAGANFRNAVFGTKEKKAMMRAALGPSRFETFQQLMNVLEATGRVNTRQSITAFATESAKNERVNIAPIAGREGGLIPGLEQLKGWWADAKVAGWREDLARAITSPESIKELEKLKRIKGSPGSKAAISIVTNALTKAGVYGPASLMEAGPPDAMPRLPSPQASQRPQAR